MARLFVVILLLCFSNTAFASDKVDDILEPLKVVVDPSFVKHHKRLKLLGLLQMCEEIELLEKVYDQKVISRDIESTFRNKSLYPYFSEDKILYSTALVSTFLAGYSTGYRLTMADFIKDNEEKKNICKMAVDETNRVLSNSD